METVLIVVVAVAVVWFVYSRGASTNISDEQLRAAEKAERSILKKEQKN